MAAVSLAVELGRAGVSMGGSPPDMRCVRAVAIDVGPCPLLDMFMHRVQVGGLRTGSMCVQLLAAGGPCSASTGVKCTVLVAAGDGLLARGTGCM